MVLPAAPTRHEQGITLADIVAAAERIKGAVRRTPLLPLIASDGRNLCVLKLETLQSTGAFKFRGAFNAVAALCEQGPVRGVTAASTGNHAIGVARAARILGVPAVIVMPRNAPKVKREAVLTERAELTLVDGSTDELNEAATTLAAQRNFVFVSSYDNPLVVAGQGTIGLELVEQLDELVLRGETVGGTPIVLVPLGGGGLASGVAIAVKALVPGSVVLGVEPETLAKGKESLASGRLVAWPDEQLERTAADGLRVSTLGGLPWRILRARLDGVLTVSEASIAHAMRVAAFSAHVVLEPAGAVALAACLAHPQSTEPVVCIASGGNVDPERFFTLAQSAE